MEAQGGLVLEIGSNAKQWAKDFEGIRKKQIPFATAVALTRTARDANEAVRESLPKKFTIRSKGLLKGWRVEPARKKDWPNCQAGVGSKDAFWLLHERGGTKRAKSGTIAIPTKAVKRTKAGRVQKSQRPSPLIEKGRAFPTKTTIEKSKAGRKDRRRLLFFRRKSVRIKKGLGAGKTVLTSTRKVYGTHFERELRAAMKSHRVREGSFTGEQGRAFYLKALRSL